MDRSVQSDSNLCGSPNEFKANSVLGVLQSKTGSCSSSVGFPLKHRHRPGSMVFWLIPDVMNEPHRSCSRRRCADRQRDESGRHRRLISPETSGCGDIFVRRWNALRLVISWLRRRTWMNTLCCSKKVFSFRFRVIYWFFRFNSQQWTAIFVRLCVCKNSGAYIFKNFGANFRVARMTKTRYVIFKWQLSTLSFLR